MPADGPPWGEWVALALATGFATVMLVALYSKLAAWDTTRRWLRDLGLAHPSLVLLAGVASEGALAVLLLAWPRWGGVATAVWLLPVTALLRRSNRLELACSCFGARPVDGRSERWLYARNAAMFTGALTLAALGGAGAPLPFGQRLGLSVTAVTLILTYTLGRPDPTRFDALPATPSTREDLATIARNRTEPW